MSAPRASGVRWTPNRMPVPTTVREPDAAAALRPPLRWVWLRLRFRLRRFRLRLRRFRLHDHFEVVDVGVLFAKASADLPKIPGHDRVSIQWSYPLALHQRAPVLCVLVEEMRLVGEPRQEAAEPVLHGYHLC